MNIVRLAKNLDLFERNREWMKAPLPVSTKLAYYPQILIAYATLISSHQKRVRFLGEDFCFDNPATPLNLQVYPYEVGVRTLRHMNDVPARMLDVGANIGQFARTLAYLAPKCQVDCIEPNPEIFGLLKKNATRSMKLYNCALGSNKGIAEFYYEPNRSAIGSFLKANAGSADHLKAIEVKIEDDVAQLTGQHTYDLTKIDVEGFELDVLHALKNVKTRYMLIEISGSGRERPYTDGQIHEAIFNTLGDYNILAGSSVSPSNDVYELMLEFV